LKQLDIQWLSTATRCQS